MTETRPAGPRIVVAHGARATEALVVARMAELAAAARRDVALLARPVRLVVPSISLRNHLSAALVRRCGALAGCRVTTLFGVAAEVLRASGRGASASRGTALFDVLVRRAARRERPLRERLEDLVDGYAVVSGTVRDFFDAGFEPAHAEALDELLASDAAALATGDEIARARALVRVVTATQEALGELPASHRSALLRAARDELESAGPELLPTRELLVHGFAEATGVVTDLLESLLRVFGGTLFLDRPSAVPLGGPRGDSAVPLGGPRGDSAVLLSGEGGYETAHTERLTLRLSQVARLEEPAPAPAPVPTCKIFAAPDPGAELREVARRVRRLLARGVRAEAIAVVARDLGGRGALVRRHFHALGVPFSGLHAPGPPGPIARRLAVLRELLLRGPALPIERWLDARRQPSAAADSELRLAFFALGASRLEDFAGLDISRPPARRRVDREELAAAAAAGRALAGELAAWREAAELRFAEHLERLRRLLDDHLGWTEEVEARAVVDGAVGDLDLPPELALAYDELVLVLLGALKDRAAEPLGGRGGGVRVLDATEARGLTCEHLFIFAVGRDVFPRPVHEDPLLPDRLRGGLTPLLPDLPIKAAGYDEERYLFAQLLSAAPRVTVSWHEEDAAGNAVAPSPLVERLRRGRPATVERAPRLLAADAAAWRPVEEELLVGALHGDRETFARLLPLALEEVRAAGCGGATEGVSSEELARARLAVLDEHDPDRRTREGRRRSRRLGPYFGFLGEVCDPDDPRRRDVSVTALENLAVCPWQTFLRRLLLVAPMPDPLASLPTLRGLLVGQLVHRVLERIAAASLGATAAWPEPPALEALLATEAERLLAERGLGLKGLARAAAELARPYLETAGRLDWPAGREPEVASVEVAETLTVADRAGRGRRLRFKADRVDRGAAGRIYTDYKTGTLSKTRRDPRQTLLDRVAAGEWLQGAAYVHAGGEAAAGRYLFLRPDLDDAERVLRVEAADAELRTAFEASVRSLLAAWDGGLFFPRLVEPDADVEPPRCASCRLAEACLRHDSGARGRLRQWAQRRREQGDAAGLDEVFLGMWLLRRYRLASPADGRRW